MQFCRFVLFLLLEKCVAILGLFYRAKTSTRLRSFRHVKIKYFKILAVTDVLKCSYSPEVN